MSKQIRNKFMKRAPPTTGDNSPKMLLQVVLTSPKQAVKYYFRRVNAFAPALTLVTSVLVISLRHVWLTSHFHWFWF